MIKATLQRIKQWYRFYKLKKKVGEYPHELQEIEEKSVERKE